MKKLSHAAWKHTETIIKAIHQHPFNVELAQGHLSLKRFAYYIEQDTNYLQNYARCHALIAAKLPVKYMQVFLRYAEGALIAEQDLVHQYYRDHLHLNETKTITPATLSYNSYLLSVCMTEPVEVAIAAILPCFWIYHDVGLAMATFSHAHHPYARWINTYASDEFKQGVLECTDIFDTLATHACPSRQAEMIEAFYKSTVLEWHFWNDAYHLVSFDNLSIDDRCMNIVTAS